MLTGPFAALLLSVVITWLVYGWVCVGWGWGVLRLLRISVSQASDYVWTFWIGLGTILCILQCWHLLLPINGYCYFVVVGGGLFLSLQALPGLFSCMVAAPRWKYWTFFICSLVLAFWIADRAAGPGSYYDAGLYHIPAMEWAQAYRAVPGLVNLHFRLGFTSSITLVMALVDQGIWTGRGSHIMNGFFLAALAAMVVRGVVGVLANGALRRPDHWLLAFCGMAVTEWGLDLQVSSFSTDLATMVFSLVSAGGFLSIFTLAAEDPRRKLLYMASLTLAAMSVSAKLSAMFFAAPLAIGILWQLWGPRAAASIRTRQTVVVLILPTVIFCGWMGREIILTGYPLFPSAIFPLPLDWRYPMADTIYNEHLIRDFARWAKADDTTQNYAWVSTWLQIRIFPYWYVWKALIPASAGIVTLLAALLCWPRLRRLPGEWEAFIWVYVCVGISLAAWWRAAPDPRFATQLFFLVFACGASLLAACCLGTAARLGVRVSILALGFLFASGPIVYFSWANQGSLMRIANAAWIMPGPDGGFHLLPHKEIRQIVLPPNVPLYVPSEGPGDQIWVAPLPNAPRPDARLRMRNPPRLQDGFRLETNPK